MLLRPRHLRRRGGRAPVLRQVGQGPHARRSGACSPASFSRPPGRARSSTWTPRRGVATTRCSGWPTKASSRRARPTRPSRSRSSSRGQPQQPRSIAPFFVEEVRKHLEQHYGAKALYESGLSVTTTLDATLQEAANRARRRRAAADRQAARLPARRDATSLAEGQTLDGFKDERWARPIAPATSCPPSSRPSASRRRPTARGCASAAITPT